MAGNDKWKGIPARQVVEDLNTLLCCWLRPQDKRCQISLPRLYDEGMFKRPEAELSHAQRSLLQKALNVLRLRDSDGLTDKEHNDLMNLLLPAGLAPPLFLTGADGGLHSWFVSTKDEPPMWYSCLQLDPILKRDVLASAALRPLGARNGSAHDDYYSAMEDTSELIRFIIEEVKGGVDEQGNTRLRREHRQLFAEEIRKSLPNLLAKRKLKRQRHELCSSSSSSDSSEVSMVYEISSRPHRHRRRRRRLDGNV